MAKMSPAEWEDFKRKTGYKEAEHAETRDTGKEHHPNREDFEKEKERKKDVDRRIERDKDRVVDRHSRDYWREKNREQEKKDREKEEDRKDARERQRAINRRAPPAPPARQKARGYYDPHRMSSGQRETGDHDLGIFVRPAGGYRDPFSGMFALGFGASGSPMSAGHYHDPFSGMFGAPTVRKGKNLSPTGSLTGGIFSHSGDPFAGMFAAPKKQPARRKKKIRR